MLGRGHDPIFRWERNAPEIRRARREVDTDLSFATGGRAEVNDLACLVFLSGAILHPQSLTFYNLGCKRDHSSVRVYNEGLRLFLECGVSVSALVRDGYWDADEHALAAPSA